MFFECLLYILSDAFMIEITFTTSYIRNVGGSVAASHVKGFSKKNACRGDISSFLLYLTVSKYAQKYTK